MDKIFEFYKSQANLSGINDTSIGRLTFDPEYSEKVKGHGHWENVIGIFLIYLIALPTLWLCWLSIVNLLKKWGLIGQPEANHMMEELRSVSIPNGRRRL